MNGDYSRGDRPDTDYRAYSDRSQAGQYDDRYTDTTGQGFNRDQAEREAREAIGQARNELQSLLENQKNAAIDQVRAVADALRRTSDELESKDQHTVATYVSHIAERVDYWAGRLRQRHIDMLAYDIRNLANRQPGLFIAGAVVIGFAATRFLRSSTIDDSTDYRGEPSPSYTNRNMDDPRLDPSISERRTGRPGDSRPMPDDSRPMTGDSRPMTGDSRPMSGEPRPVREDTPSTGPNPGYGGSNDRYRP